MADDQKDRYIQYLAEQNQDLRSTSDAMKLVLEDFMAQMKELKEQMASMQSKQSDLENLLSEERKLRKSAERNAKNLQEQLDYALQEQFGDKRQRYALMLKRMILTDKRRKLPTQCNNSLHYGSNAGAEMAAIYHSVIGTVKLHGSSIWSFIGTFFKNIFNGRRDYVNMVPDKITLATSQC